MRLAALLLGVVTAVLPIRTPAQPARSGPWSVDLVDPSGTVLPTFEHRGRTYVLGTLGQRYLVRVRNDTPRRAEVVVSVDGRDVLDGRPASLGKRGYVVEPYGEVTIDGYRLSLEAVAAFRFSTVPRSYAARSGDARDVGVIGVAVFDERPPRPIAPAYPPPRPYERDDRRAAPELRSEAPASPRAQGDVAGAPPGATAQAPRPGAPERPGLGTEFGEERGSRASRVTFDRATSRPAAVLTLRYDDRDGLLALGIDVDRAWRDRDDAWLRETAEPFRREVGFAEPPPGWRSR